MRRRKFAPEFRTRLLDGQAAPFHRAATQAAIFYHGSRPGACGRARQRARLSAPLPSHRGETGSRHRKDACPADLLFGGCPPRPTGEAPLKTLIAIAAGTFTLSVAARAAVAGPPEYNRGYDDCLAGRYNEAQNSRSHKQGCRAAEGERDVRTAESLALYGWNSERQRNGSPSRL
jgi:hypothetical protein